MRDAHAKSHGFLKGELIVHELPSHLRQGLFARPANYPVVIRLSSAPGDIHSDTIPAPRGMAIKVIGVDGERLLPEDKGHNQDFLLVNIPTLSFGTIGKYRQLISLLEKNAQNPAFLQRAMAGVARGVEAAVEAVGVEPGATLRGLARDNNHLLGETYHSMAAIRFGDYIAKISAAPLSDNVRALTGKDVGTVEDATMRDLVVEHFRDQGAEYQLRAQLCADLDKMPVEDAAVLWPEELSPHQPIATLRIPPQDAYSPARRVYGDDVLSFNPWHGIRDHQPLGSIMRVRIAAYERSTRYRHEMNAQPRAEPASIDVIPD
ncbi:catalase family protein [Sphingomonas sp. SFZ2018-12]|uniref:catalase family protein n=1 Tax=Sphingomonas sp. SFZ2018-12 TaxID=2683197 RepID=UPI001F0FF2A8|nr:catalase family protein [Sphingomonas sp. SFZ2018-12]